MSFKNLLFFSATLSSIGSAGAQEIPFDDPEAFPDEIVVVAERRSSTILGDIEPELSLDARQIRSYGVSSIAELMEALEPQTRSSSGRRGSSGGPAVLLNGRRISGFREIRQYPPEALSRVEILPEEVALKYGFSADQRVVNFILRERFRALTADARALMPTEGGAANGEISANRLRLRNDQRVSVDLSASHASKLLESERDLPLNPDADLFDSIGNVAPAGGAAEIDPSLSALVGAPVSIAGAPATAASGALSLNDFALLAGNANITDEGPYRTLSPRKEDASIGIVFSDVLFDDISATANVSLDYSTSEALRGLANGALNLPAGNPFSPFSQEVEILRAFEDISALRRRSDNWDGSAGFVLNGPVRPWTWSFSGQYSREERQTETDRSADISVLQSLINTGANPFGSDGDAVSIIREESSRITHAGTAEATAFGDLFALPAGDASASVKLGGVFRRQSSSNVIGGIATRSSLGRNEATAQANVDIPVFARDKTWDAIGELSFSANARFDRFSDFQSLETYGYGANWRPISGVQIVASVSHEENAPSIQQLGEVVSATPNVRLFDFVAGESVSGVTRIDGGNPGLLAEKRRLIRANLKLDPFKETDLGFVASYTDERVTNAVNSFPAPTAEIETAFPERFVRDSAGSLLEFDARPINFAETRRRTLRYGFNFSKTIKSNEEPLSDEERTQLREIFRRGRGERRGDNTSRGGDRGERSGGGNRGGRGGGWSGRRGGRDGRLYFSANHEIALADSIQIAAGSPTLNLLDGEAVDAGGGASRHRVDATLGYSKQGLGARAQGEWKSAARIAGATPVDDLRFSSLGTVDLSLFADLGQKRKLLIKYPFLRGSRVSLNIENIFNERQSVVDGAGATPFRYDPIFLDPEGRTITLRFRKLFF